MTAAFGTWGDHEVYSVTLSSPSLQATVLTLGASLSQVLAADREGRMASVCVGWPSLEPYAGRYRASYVGCSMGRFSRIVENGLLTVDGESHQLSLNEGSHHVHGGVVGFNHRVWDIVEAANREVVLRLYSPDGDQGYPGDLVAYATFRLTGRSGDTLQITYEATANRTTLCDLVSHTFWNPGGVAPLAESTLTLHTASQLELDCDGVPSGRAGPVGPRTNFSAPRLIGDVRLDDFFTLDPARSTLPAAEIHHERSGRLLQITTSQPGLGVYSADSPLLQRAGLCVQPSALPYAPRRLGPSAAVLLPGQKYFSRTEYLVSVR